MTSTPSTYTYQDKTYTINDAASVMALKRYNQLKLDGKTAWLGLKVTGNSIELTATHVSFWNKLERIFGGKWDLEQATDFLNRDSFKLDNFLKNTTTEKITPSIKKWNENHLSKNIDKIFSQEMPATVNDSTIKCSREQLSDIISTLSPKGSEKIKENLFNDGAFVRVGTEKIGIASETLFTYIKKSNASLTKEQFNKVLSEKSAEFSARKEATPSARFTHATRTPSQSPQMAATIAPPIDKAEIRNLPFKEAWHLGRNEDESNSDRQTKAIINQTLNSIVGKDFFGYFSSSGLDHHCFYISGNDSSLSVRELQEKFKAKGLDVEVVENSPVINRETPALKITEKAWSQIQMKI